MGEEPKNENKPEFKGNLGFIWLVGILVILLGSTVVYVCKLKREVNDLKQTPQVPVQPVATAQEQAKTETENTTTAVKEETKTENTEKVDKDAQEVYGLDTKFKELSKAAIKTNKTWEEKNGKWKEKKINIEYDLNGDGKTEKLTGSGEKISLNGSVFYKSDEETRCTSLCIVDLDENDNSKEVILEEASGTGAGEWIYFTIYKLNNGKLKEVSYKLSNDGDIAIDKFYLDGKGKFIVLDEIQKKLSPLFATEYFVLNNNKTTSNKIDISKISNKEFIISKSGEKDDTINYYVFSSEKEIEKNHQKMEKELKKYTLNSDTKINILSYKDRIMKVKLSNGNIKYICSAQRLYW